MTYLKHLPVGGLSNCRDLGGFACDGGVTRYGVFLRSEVPYRITETGIQYLREYGLTETFDLRGENEADYLRSKLRDVLPYRIIPLRGGAETFAKHNLPEGEFSWDKIYIMRATTHWDWVRDCVNACAEAEGCVLFHCTTGKDRTGMLTCCLLGALGVSREDIAADYCLSEVYLQEMFAAMRDGSLTTREGKTHFEDYVFHTPFTAMIKLYDFLTAKHGSVRNYLLDIGVTEETLEKLRAKLVDPA